MVGAAIGLGAAKRRKASLGPLTDAIITAIRAKGWAANASAPPASFDPVGNPRTVALSRAGFNGSGGTTTSPRRCSSPRVSARPTPARALSMHHASRSPTTSIRPTASSAAPPTTARRSARSRSAAGPRPIAALSATRLPARHSPSSSRIATPATAKRSPVPSGPSATVPP